MRQAPTLAELADRNRAARADADLRHHTITRLTNECPLCRRQFLGRKGVTKHLINGHGARL